MIIKILMEKSPIWWMRRVKVPVERWLLNNFLDQVHPNLEAFLKRSSETLDNQRIKLNFKPLLEIKANLTNIQQEWKLSNNNDSIRKE